jgi:ATP/maltotriose-dependent transcriptional regulator MalT
VRAGLRGAIAFPALCGEEVLAVFGFAGRERIELTERLTDCLLSIGTEIGRFLSRRRGELGPPVLSRRETEVLQLAAEGNPGPRIAERLHISVATVRTHFEHIYEKLEVSDRGTAVATGLREGLIQ